MNQQEYLELHSEIAQIVYNYERFSKEGYLIDMKYNATFGDDLIKINFYQRENNMLAGVAKLFNEGKTEEEIVAFVTDYQARYIDEEKGILAKHTYAQKFVQTYEGYTLEYHEMVEKAFAEYVNVNHPAVKVLVNKEEPEIYQDIKKAYMNSDLDGLNKIIKFSEGKLLNPQMNDELVAKQNEMYYQTRIQIGKDLQARGANYPYTKKDVFKDEIETAAESGEIRANLNKLAGQNKQIHKEVEGLVGKDYKLVSNI